MCYTFVLHMIITKRILIPTDFTVQSLQFVVEVIDKHTADKIEVVLVYGRYLSTSITEIFAQSKDEILDDLQSADFIDACEIIRNCFKSKLTELYADVIQSDNYNYIKNYIVGIKADDVILPKNSVFELKDKRAFDVRARLEEVLASNVTVVDNEYSLADIRSKDDIISLFFREKLDVTFQ